MPAEQTRKHSTVGVQQDEDVTRYRTESFMSVQLQTHIQPSSISLHLHLGQISHRRVIPIRRPEVTYELRQFGIDDRWCDEVGCGMYDIFPPSVHDALLGCTKFNGQFTVHSPQSRIHSALHRIWNLWCCPKSKAKSQVESLMGWLLYCVAIYYSNITRYY